MRLDGAAAVEAEVGAAAAIPPGLLLLLLLPLRDFRLLRNSPVKYPAFSVSTRLVFPVAGSPKTLSLILLMQEADGINWSM